MAMKNFLPYHVKCLPQRLIQKAEEELKETDEIRSLSLDKLRALILAEKKLKCPMEDEYLIQFLRARKFDVKKAFNLLQNNCQIKKSYPELCDINLDEIRKTIANDNAFCLPYRDEEGCVVLVLQLGKWKVEETNIAIALTALTCILLMIVEEPATQICGVRVLVDVKGFNLKQMKSLTPRYISLISKALRNCLPMRFKGIHFLNESPIFQYIWSLLRMILTEKIKSRIHFHGDSQKSLQKFIPKDILTSEYGGDNNTLNGAEWCLGEIENYFDKFLKIANCE
ncbi:retinaldehyde-binding protein 1 [Caerostris darwini]|uniref:Retinaldehyde-binding protein 1 n=1 Tax=Caerostris darwini TaxID=1538125 RepID=A0AAV4RK51_9ARAC|nr:retinaldehyde-binding protein 1 [Caerostris darwini]